jgi:hemerythrin-like domain-containing protein
VLAPRGAIHVIFKEHEQLSAVIAGMLRFVRLLETGGKTPGLMVFRAMLYYIREYPEQVHHPKEDNYLFARLRQPAILMMFLPSSSHSTLKAK